MISKICMFTSIAVSITTAECRGEQHRAEQHRAEQHSRAVSDIDRTECGFTYMQPYHRFATARTEATPEPADCNALHRAGRRGGQCSAAPSKKKLVPNQVQCDNHEMGGERSSDGGWTMREVVCGVWCVVVQGW